MKIERISIDDIIVDEKSPLLKYRTLASKPNNSFELLKASIKERGILIPIDVFDLKNGKYQLFNGFHRVRACKILGIKTIVACIGEVQNES